MERYQQGDPTDLLDDPKPSYHEQGPPDILDV